MKTYGIENESVENIVYSLNYTPNNNELLMDGARPTADHIAKAVEGNAAYGVWVLPVISLINAQSAKYSEIISGANGVKAALSARFSVIEESTWAEQEAGARAILHDEINCKNETAVLLLANEMTKAKSVAFVEQLASVDGVSAESFAGRIIANADAAHEAGKLTLLEQRKFEVALNAATTVETVQAIEVTYTLCA